MTRYHRHPLAFAFAAPFYYPIVAAILVLVYTFKASVKIVKWLAHL